MKHLPIYIVILALVLRGIICWQMAELPSVRYPSRQTDMATYIRLAGEISQGHFPDHYDYQPFYYTVFLPLARCFSSDGVMAAMVLQILAGTAAVWLAWLTAARIWGRKAGWLAAFLLAVDRIHVFYTPFMLLEVLQSFWLMLVLWLTCMAWRRNRWWLWLLDALLIAVATLTRGNAVLLMPGFLALLLWRNLQTAAGAVSAARRWGYALALAVTAFLLFELPQLPFAWVNYRYTGRWCGASTAGDKVLALGNTPEAPPGGLEYPLTYAKWVEQSDRHPGEGRVSMASNILAWACREPLVFAELKARALLLFWDKGEIPNNVSLQREGQASFLTRYPLLLSFAVVGTLALLGLWDVTARLFRGSYHRPYLLIVLYMVLSSWLGTALFYNLSRFRLSALPLLCVLGGAAVATLCSLQNRRRFLGELERKKLIYTRVLVILCAFFLVNIAYSLYQNHGEPAVMRVIRPHGVQCVFPDTTLIYDHGPLSFGGLEFAVPQQEGIAFTKTFDLGDLTEEKPPKIRIPVIAEGRVAATLVHDGKQYSLDGSHLVSDRFMTWLEVQLESFNSKQPLFTWHFPGNQQVGIGFDYCRDYGRTTVNNFSYPAEAAAELQW